MNNKFKKGDVVFINYTPMNSDIMYTIKCIVADDSLTSRSTGKAIYRLEIVSNSHHPESIAVDEDNVFATEIEAIDAIQKQKESIATERELKIIEKYKSEINNLIDLLKFPLKHNFEFGEYTDTNAISVYCQKAREITGVDISDNTNYADDIDYD